MLPVTSGVTRLPAFSIATSFAPRPTKSQSKQSRPGFRFTRVARRRGPSSGRTAAVNSLKPAKNRRLLMMPRSVSTRIQPGRNLELGAKTMNLITDPWIPISSRNGGHSLVGLDELFAHAADIGDLVAKPHERIALLRLFICVTQAALDGPDDRSAWEECQDE